MKKNKRLWDNRYDTDEYVYGIEPNQFLMQNIEHIPKGKVLCVADGEGRNGVWLAEQGYDVISIDYSKAAIHKIKKLADENGVNINTICTDLLNYDFGKNKYDGIVSIFSHFNADETRSLLLKYIAALKPNGVFITEVFAKEQLPLESGGPKDINLLYDTKLFSDTLSTMQKIILKKDIIWLHEGSLHEGKAVVVRGIFKKSQE